jgi:hypothetical protein
VILVADLVDHVAELRVVRWRLLQLLLNMEVLLLLLMLMLQCLCRRLLEIRLLDSVQDGGDRGVLRLLLLAGVSVCDHLLLVLVLLLLHLLVVGRGILHVRGELGHADLLVLYALNDLLIVDGVELRRVHSNQRLVHLVDYDLIVRMMLLMLLVEMLLMLLLLMLELELLMHLLLLVMVLYLLVLLLLLGNSHAVLADVVIIMLVECRWLSNHAN